MVQFLELVAREDFQLESAEVLKIVLIQEGFFRNSQVNQEHLDDCVYSGILIVHNEVSDLFKLLQAQRIANFTELLFHGLAAVP